MCARLEALRRPLLSPLDRALLRRPRANPFPTLPFCASVALSLNAPLGMRERRSLWGSATEFEVASEVEAIATAAVGVVAAEVAAAEGELEAAFVSTSFTVVVDGGQGGLGGTFTSLRI